MRSLSWYEIGNQLSLRIIRAAQDVYDSLGPGYPEEHYRAAVTKVLERQKLDVQFRFPVDIWECDELVDLIFLDLFVEMQVVVTILASRSAIGDVQRLSAAAQVQAVGAPVGILLNFGKRRFEYERIFPE